MRPSRTYELRILITEQSGSDKTKQELMAWLNANDVNEFVEGTVEGLNEDFDYDNPARDMYSEFGGNQSPISVYKFAEEELESLKKELSKAFGNRLDCSIHSMETTVWTDGWKESFKPFETNLFYLFPSHDKPEKTKKIPIEIEAGMAFGTGQHATTKLCLTEIENIHTLTKGLKKTFLDVGTGTGILSIGAKKLGWKRVVSTDIDPDAILATSDNAKKNGVDLEVLRASVPTQAMKKGLPKQYDVVVANILAVVLRKIIKDLAAATKKGGILVLSGLLLEEKVELTSLAEAEGMALSSAAELEGWSCLNLRRK